MTKEAMITTAKLVKDAYDQNGVLAFNLNIEWSDPVNKHGLQSVAEIHMREEDFIRQFPKHIEDAEYRWASYLGTKFYCLKHKEGASDEDI